jgi:hypothetical protein
MKMKMEWEETGPTQKTTQYKIILMMLNSKTISFKIIPTISPKMDQMIFNP